MVSEWKLKKLLGWTLKQRIMIKNLLHLSWWFWNDTILGLHLDFCGRWQELYNWSHPSTMAPSHALKLIDWRSSQRPSCFLSSYTENLLISQRTGFIHIIWYDMELTWKWVDYYSCRRLSRDLFIFESPALCRILEDFQLKRDGNEKQTKHYYNILQNILIWRT